MQASFHARSGHPVGTLRYAQQPIFCGAQRAAGNFSPAPAAHALVARAAVAAAAVAVAVATAVGCSGRGYLTSRAIRVFTGMFFASRPGFCP